MPRLDLKTCPFCDGEAKHCRTAKAYHVYCSCCVLPMVSTINAMTTCQVVKLKIAAFNKWNTRITPKQGISDA